MKLLSLEPESSASANSAMPAYSLQNITIIAYARALVKRFLQPFLLFYGRRSSTVGTRRARGFRGAAVKPLSRSNTPTCTELSPGGESRAMQGAPEGARRRRIYIRRAAPEEQHSSVRLFAPGPTQSQPSFSIARRISGHITSTFHQWPRSTLTKRQLSGAPAFR